MALLLQVRRRGIERRDLNTAQTRLGLCRSLRQGQSRQRGRGPFGSLPIAEWVLGGRDFPLHLDGFLFALPALFAGWEGDLDLFVYGFAGRGGQTVPDGFEYRSAGEETEGVGSVVRGGAGRGDEFEHAQDGLAGGKVGIGFCSSVTQSFGLGNDAMSQCHL